MVSIDECEWLNTLFCMRLQGEGDAAIAVWTKQEKGGITLTDSISSYVLGGMYNLLCTTSML